MDKFGAILKGASIAVSVLANEDATDIEMLPVLPRALPHAEVEELAERWSDRGLRFIGAIALVDGKPRSALAEPLDAVRMAALSDAFVVYVESLLSSAIEERCPQGHQEPYYDWAARRYRYN